jgi:hypothetical protein
MRRDRIRKEGERRLEFAPRRAEKASAITQSERAQRDVRIAQLETEIEKAKSEKNAIDTTVALQEAELRELRKQNFRRSRSSGRTTGTR